MRDLCSAHVFGNPSEPEEWIAPLFDVWFKNCNNLLNGSLVLILPEFPKIVERSVIFLQAIRRRQLEVDRVELKRKIKEAVEQFDAKLLDLYKTRLAIEKCILAEELKILLYDRRMSIQDHLDREEERLQ